MRQLLPVVAIVATLAVPIPAQATPGEMLPATSSDHHLWYVVERSTPAPGIELRHAARSMEDAQYSRAMPLSGRPEALAAWGQQLWLIYAPTEPGRGRDVFTVQVERNPAIGGWFFRPHDRLRAVASLRATGQLVDFVGTARGPIVLLRPEPPSRRGPAADAPGPVMLQLRGRDWAEMPLPAALPAGSEVRCLGVSGDDGQRLVLFTSARERGRTAVYRRGGDERWSAPTELDLPPPSLLATTRVRDNLLLVTGPTADELVLSYLRPTTVLELGSVQRPQGRWAVRGLRDRINLLEQTPDGAVQAATIDPVTGETGTFTRMTQQPVMTGRLLHRPLLFALAITALMLVFLFRPNSGAAEVALPASLVVLPLMPRTVALLVDLGVGAATALLLLRCAPAELLHLPLWTTDLAASTPYLVMAGVTMLHSAAAELVSCRSLGKSLVGARVTTLDGSRPRLAAIVVRNLFKALVLLIPVLAVFALLTPHLQGLGDSMARTVVVRPAGTAVDGKSKDR